MPEPKPKPLTVRADPIVEFDAFIERYVPEALHAHLLDNDDNAAEYVRRLIRQHTGAGIGDDVAWLSVWNDQRGVDQHIRMLKISEEYGEATEAYLGYLGANPRKGVTNGIEQVWLELADTALAALVAIASLGGNPEAELLRRIAFVKARMEAQEPLRECVCSTRWSTTSGSASGAACPVVNVSA